MAEQTKSDNFIIEVKGLGAEQVEKTYGILKNKNKVVSK